MTLSHEFDFSVRYHETDAQGHVHHAVYLQYFELARTEMLKARGYDYAQMEREGKFMVVTEAHCKYIAPCKFGDTLRIRIEIVHAKGVRIRHEYKLFRDETLLAEGKTTAACITPDGKLQRIPDWLLLENA